ncbi:DUF3408 domain-containing protein [Petrimonas sulfuriphila]|jgi:hypothetical protein|uniref:DUF3408 domain-containing protein n=1 Tax=Petrimonas TaxID=307628 RepID=UPI001329542C|nr:MAG: DUF3408 domain-containing protein [Paludibacter sp.]MEA4996594.1 DUF3408 domain-containing protein [Petrimonas sp.]MEA5070516.1 DUF3408 domain-containing protein [Petrimonas sp.]MEA5081143.1 DUF3408 domain-containing protein [Dysgonamonadaceae bacterium]
MKKIKLFGRKATTQGMPAKELTSNKQVADSYVERFIKPKKLRNRQCVYISNDIHVVIARLVRALANAGNEVTLGGYIDTILEEHLQLHKEEINEIYRQRPNDLL